MAAYLFCLTTGGGVPIFSRIKGDLKPLPFPVIGSLNGVHMFANTHDVSLLSTTTEDAKVVWRVFHDSVTLIGVVQDDNADDCHVSHFLSLVFNAMVLLCGLDDVSNIKNVERFKKDIKVCFPLVDHLLEQTDMPTFSDLTNAVDIFAAPENALLQKDGKLLLSMKSLLKEELKRSSFREREFRFMPLDLITSLPKTKEENYIDAFTEMADSPYGCLFIHGKMAVATKRWWSLSATELILISKLLVSLSPCSSRDVPVFLPDASPTVPHRLMTFQLTKYVEVCVLCGPSPSLADLEQEVSRFWRAGYELLKSALQLHPRNFPHTVTIDSNILGFILVNTETNRCLCSTQPYPSPSKESISNIKRKQILRAFYKHVIGNYFSSTVEGSKKGPAEFTHNALETYITTDNHKCYALSSAPYQIFLLFNTSTPTFAMRSVTQKTLNMFLKDKHVQV